MTFSEALERIKHGYKIARSNWNGENLYVFLHEGYDTNENKYITTDAHNYMHPYFIIKCGDGELATWVPSVTDCLADDWYVVV